MQTAHHSVQEKCDEKHAQLAGKMAVVVSRYRQLQEQNRAVMTQKREMEGTLEKEAQSLKEIRTKSNKVIAAYKESKQKVK